MAQSATVREGNAYCVRNDLYVKFARAANVAVDADVLLTLKGHLQCAAFEAVKNARVFFGEVCARLIRADQAQESKARDGEDLQDIDLTVAQCRPRVGMKTAAAELAVGHGGQLQIAHLHRPAVLGNMCGNTGHFEEGGRHADDVSKLMRKMRPLIVFVLFTDNLAIKADVNHVDAGTLVGIEQVDWDGFSVKLGVNVKKELLWGHVACKVVARAAGNQAKLGIRAIDHADQYLAKRTVATTCIKADRILRGGIVAQRAHRFGGIPCKARDVNHVINAACLTNGFYLCCQGVVILAAARRGVDEKNVSHSVTPLLHTYVYSITD